MKRAAVWRRLSQVGCSDTVGASHPRAPLLKALTRGGVSRSPARHRCHSVQRTASRRSASHWKISHPAPNRSKSNAGLCSTTGPCSDAGGARCKTSGCWSAMRSHRHVAIPSPPSQAGGAGVAIIAAASAVAAMNYCAPWTSGFTVPAPPPRTAARPVHWRTHRYSNRNDPHRRASCQRPAARRRTARCPSRSHSRRR